jgi:hypothetical protein
MKIICGMATTSERMQYADKAINSIIRYVDDLHLYNNSVNIDRADNGKYWGLFLYSKEPVYYLTLDDDIIYPPDYVDTMLEAVEKHNSIVTHHGRILKGTGLNYYSDHKAFNFFSKNEQETILDVFGSGVTAHRSDYFNPKDMPFEKQLMMSDLVASLKAAEQGKVITLLKHEAYWLKPQRIPTQLTISGTRHLRIKQNNELADKIWLIKNKS